jgi:thiosulfate dehydrogenase
MYNRGVPRLVLIALLAASAAACRDATRERDDGRHGPLVAATTTMVTAWEVPQNPFDDPKLAASPLGAQVRRGYRLFVDTPREAPAYVHSRMSCSNCHLNGGQRERALPVVGVAAMFPEFNKRAGRLITLNDRIVDCFMRSENGVDAPEAAPPSTGASEVLALAAYITWLSHGQAMGRAPAWRGQNTIADAHLVPVASLDPKRGETLFTEKCTSCHGADGQGVAIGDKRAGPLWGDLSWNDGAGAARVYTLAGIIRYSMPYLDPGSLSDDDAQQIAAYITSKPRPAYPFKSRDYPGAAPPVDAVYYRAER